MRSGPLLARAPRGRESGGSRWPGPNLPALLSGAGAGPNLAARELTIAGGILPSTIRGGKRLDLACYIHHCLSAGAAGEESGK